MHGIAKIITWGVAGVIALGFIFRAGITVGEDRDTGGCAEKDGCRCAEFVAKAHIEGDPDATDFPWSKEVEGCRYPRVSELADKDFAPERLAYIEDEEQFEPGDIIVWYDHDRDDHLAAIYIGNDEVIHQDPVEGVKKNTIQAVTKELKINPIARRYIYTKED